MPALGLASYCYLKNLFELESKFQDVEDDATTEADDGRTATIYIHHTVGIRRASCLFASSHRQNSSHMRGSSITP